MEKQTIESFTCLKINKNHTDFEGLVWVAKVRSLDNHRFELNKILSEKGKLIATDGMRLHLYTMKESDNIPEGAYLPIARNNGFILLQEVSAKNYPKWKKVFPKRKKETILQNIWIGKDEINTAMNFAILLKNIELGMLYRFFLGLATDEWKITIYDMSESPIRFENYKKEGKKVALIMPMRI